VCSRAYREILCYPNGDAVGGSVALFLKLLNIRPNRTLPVFFTFTIVHPTDPALSWSNGTNFVFKHGGAKDQGYSETIRSVDALNLYRHKDDSLVIALKLERWGTDGASAPITTRKYLSAGTQMHPAHEGVCSLSLTSA
jgi:hypothetical protein